jgi:hypothetical protein
MGIANMTILDFEHRQAGLSSLASILGDIADVR